MSSEYLYQATLQKVGMGVQLRGLWDHFHNGACHRVPNSLWYINHLTILISVTCTETNSQTTDYRICKTEVNLRLESYLIKLSYCYRIIQCRVIRSISCWNRKPTIIVKCCRYSPKYSKRPNSQKVFSSHCADNYENLRRVPSWHNLSLNVSFCTIPTSDAEAKKKITLEHPLTSFSLFLF